MKRIMLFTFVIICAIPAALISGCQKSYSGPVEPITIANWPNEISSLIYVAIDQKYFTADGLNVTLKNYTTVAEGVNGMLRGEADIAIASEFVLAGKALDSVDIRTLGTVDKVVQVSIIGRKDRGVTNISDLAGKRIGVFQGAAVEFYLGRFLELNGVDQSRITLVDTSSLNMVDTLVSGAVDAVITGQPNIDKIKSALGEDCVAWPAQSNQPTFYNALCTSSWASAHPAAMKKFLTSLDRAESYVAKNPDASKGIVQKQVNYDAAYMSAVWPDHQFTISLDQSLVLAMEDEARWIVSNNVTSAKTVPNFLDFIYADGLKAVKPGAVRIAGK